MTLKLSKTPAKFWAEFPPVQEKPKHTVNVRDELLNELTLAAMEHQSDSQAVPLSQAELEDLADALLTGARQGKLMLMTSGEPEAADPARFVLGMRLSVWKLLLDRVPGARGCEVVLGPELAAGGKALAAGLKTLQVRSIEAWVPEKAGSMDFTDPDPHACDHGPWHPSLTIRGGAGAQLREVHVSLGAEVAGDEWMSDDVPVHFKNADGNIVKSLPLEVLPPDPRVREVQPIDLQAVEAYRKAHQGSEALKSFASALKEDETFCNFFPFSEFGEKKVAEIFNKLVKAVSADDGKVVDSSTTVMNLLDMSETDENIVAALPQRAWAALRSHPQAQFSEVMSSERLSEFLRENEALAPEQLTFNGPVYEAYKSFKSAVTEDKFFCDLCPDFDAWPFFRKVVDCVLVQDPGVIDLQSDCPEDVALVIAGLPRRAWDALLQHPKAVELTTLQCGRFLGELLMEIEDFPREKLAIDIVEKRTADQSPA